MSFSAQLQGQNRRLQLAVQTDQYYQKNKTGCSLTSIPEYSINQNQFSLKEAMEYQQLSRRKCGDLQEVRGSLEKRSRRREEQRDLVQFNYFLQINIKL